MDSKVLRKTDRLAGTPLRFMGDRMCDFVVKLTPPDLVVRPVRTFPELKSAFKLIYKEYVSQGYCERNKSRMHYSSYSLLPSARTFVLKKKRALLGTISLVADSIWGLPMEAVFPGVVEGFRREGRKLGEASLLGIRGEAFRRRETGLTEHHRLTGSCWLFKTMLDYARHVAGVTDLLIAVHPKHEKLYRNFAFTPVGEAVSYDHAKGNPALPMYLDILDLEAQLPEGKSFKNFFFKMKPPAHVLKRSYECTPDAMQELYLKSRQGARSGALVGK